MDEKYQELFDRIRNTCRQQRWHGPDRYNPYQMIEQMRQHRIQFERTLPSQSPLWGFTSLKTAHYWYDKNGKQYEISEDTDLSVFPLQANFEYAPASHEQLIASEKILGFTFPPLLRSIYAQIANGGFGPGNGIIGAIGGYHGGRFDNDNDPTNDQRSREKSALEFDFFANSSQKYLEIPFEKLPIQSYCLCEGGADIYAILDCRTELVYLGTGEDTWRINTKAISLYEWLELWMNGVDVWSMY